MMLPPMQRSKNRLSLTFETRLKSLRIVPTMAKRLQRLLDMRDAIDTSIDIGSSSVGGQRRRRWRAGSDRGAWQYSIQNLVLGFSEDREKLAAYEVDSKCVVIGVKGGIERIFADWEYFLHVGDAVFEDQSLAIFRNGGDSA